MKKQKWKNPEEMQEYLKDLVPSSMAEKLIKEVEQKRQLVEISQAAIACMICSTLPSYDKEFPQLGVFTDGEGRHTHVFKVQNPISHDEAGNTKLIITSEAVLN